MDFAQTCDRNSVLRIEEIATPFRSFFSFLVRTTATSSKGMYYLVQDFYSNTNKVNLTYYNAANMSLKAFYILAAHKKKDMIVR